jgi:retron-type reverse transcriptase
MKTYKHLYEQIYQFDNLYDAYLKARRGKRQRAEVLRFEANLEGELIQLQNELMWDSYRTGPYRVFKVYEPKERIAASLPFRDRVLQHSLVATIEPIWEKRFYYHSYACRPGKGAHAGADRAQQWLREVKRTHGHVYCLKADVRSYFASVNHGALIKILSRRIRCPRTMDLCRHIVSTWNHGIPIGNLTSQLFANIYLNEFDQYIKQLRVKRYIRYMDDWVVVHHDKEYLRAIRKLAEEWLRNELGLELNQKTQIFPVSLWRGRALDFLGYRIWPTHRRLRKGSIQRMRRRLLKMQQLYRCGLIGLKEIQQRIMSWIGYTIHANSYHIRQRILWEVGFIKTKGSLGP